MTGKHSSDEEFDFGSLPWKKIGIVLIIIISIFLIWVGVYFGVKTYKEKEKEESEKNLQEQKKEDESKMPKEIEGYKVLGKVVIEKLEIDQYILDSFEDKALEKGVGKLYGENLNDEGNFTIVGHNYDKVFKRLQELEVGDEFYIQDIKDNNKEEKYYYKINEILEIEPTDLSAILPKEEKTEITLITCDDGATSRLMVKSEKIDKKENLDAENNTSNENETNENTATEQ